MSTAIRSRLISSGQMELTAALQTAEGSDASVREARDLARDPMFDQKTVQEAGPMGTVGNASAPASWANVGTTACDTSRRLYCFER